MWEEVQTKEQLLEVVGKLKEGSTFAHQKDLPRLPIPSLRETFERYIKSVQPFAENQQELETTRKLAYEFFMRVGGNKLQKDLEAKETDLRQQGKEESWLEAWWYQMAYHIWKDPIPIISNVYCVMKDHPIASSLHGAKNVDPLVRAAGLIHSSSLFHILLQKGKVPVDVVGKKPVCMDQYTRLFSTCRIPAECDYIAKYNQSESKNVVILMKGHYFSFDVIDKQGNLISDVDILFQLRTIQHILKDQPRDLPLGALTYLRRDEWAHARQKIYSHHPANRESLEVIQRSILLTCFDDESPTSEDDIAQLTLVGKGRDRFFDKTIQLILYANGRFGLNGEHSPLDAPPVAHGYVKMLMIMETVEDYVRLSKSLPSRRLLAPSKLVWSFTPDIVEIIRKAEVFALNWANTNQLTLCRFNTHGSEFLKKSKMGPDTFVQICLQLAFYRLHNRVTATYESASTRKFSHGRTETVRALTSDVAEFVQHFKTYPQNPSEVQKCIQLLKEAAASHVEYLMAASNGKGVDRHMLGLRMCMTGPEGSEIFADKLHLKSTKFHLSSSNMSPGDYWFGGFGSAIDDCYGCCYSIQPNDIWVSVASRTICDWTDSHKYSQALKQAFTDVGKLISQIPSRL